MATVKSYQQPTYNRRAHTEMPGAADQCDAYDINNLPDNEEEHAAAIPVDEDVDDINYQNYKGIYANDESGQKYQCPETGAHFEWQDLCKRMMKILDMRKADEEKQYSKQVQQQQVRQPVEQQQVKQQYNKQQQNQQYSQQQHQAYQNQQQQQQTVNVLGASNNEIFSSSIMSEKLDKNHTYNMQPGNQKIIQFKNKFEELAQQQQQPQQSYNQRPVSKGGLVTQLKVQEKPLSGNSRNNKENCYSFLQQKSMKNLTEVNGSNLIMQSSGVSGAVQHNKRQSHDKIKQGSSGSQSGINAVDTYNKLMQIMNEKVLKNVSSAITGSRGKSIDKTSAVTSITKTLNQPAIINQSSSSKKLKTFATNASNSHTTYLTNNGNSQSRDKSQHQTISTALKSQNKITSGTSRNANAGIQGQQNTQNATKQFMSFYSNNLNNQTSQPVNKRMTDTFQQNQSSSLNMMRESSNKKLSSQKSTGSINNARNNANISKGQQNIDAQGTINDIMSKYMKQQQNSGVMSNGQTLGSETQKSRNSNMISSSKTVSESLQKAATSHSKTSSRPITAINNGVQQFQVPTSHVLQAKMLNGSNNVKSKSGSGLDFGSQQSQMHQSRNSNQFQQFSHMTAQSQLNAGDTMNDYLRRVEYQNASNEGGYTSTALHDLQRKIESKNKSRGGIAGVGVTQNSYYSKQLQNMSQGGNNNGFAHQQQRSSTNMTNYFSGGHRQ